MSRHPARHAFTLIELLTVIAIIGILAAILIPITGRVRASARQTTCLSNLRQLHLGVLLFAQDNKDLLPALYHAKPWYTVLREGYLSDPGVFFCRSAANEPALSANFIPYGYNLNISGGGRRGPLR